MKKCKLWITFLFWAILRVENRLKAKFCGAIFINAWLFHTIFAPFSSALERKEIKKTASIEAVLNIKHLNYSEHSYTVLYMLLPLKNIYLQPFLHFRYRLE